MNLLFKFWPTVQFYVSRPRSSGRGLSQVEEELWKSWWSANAEVQNKSSLAYFERKSLRKIEKSTKNNMIFKWKKFVKKERKSWLVLLAVVFDPPGPRHRVGQRRPH